MRELFLIVIVGAISCASLVAPIVGLYGYIWFALMRPDVLAWSSHPFSMILAAVTFVGMLRFLHWTARIFVNPIVLTLLALQIPIYLSAVFAVIPAFSERPYDLYQKVVLMALLIPVLVQTREQLKWLVILMGASLGFLGTKYGLFGLMRGGTRFTDGPGGFLADNNCFALALVMAFPLLWYSAELVENHAVKLVLKAMAFFTVATVVMTFSRGAAVSLAFVFVLQLAGAKRKFALALAIAATCTPTIYLVKNDYFNRLSTITNPEEEASANSRILYAKMAIQMAQDYPWLGVGFGTRNQMRLQPEYLPWVDQEHRQVVHNTYLQMLTDSGVFAFAIYVVLLWGTTWWLGRSAKRMREFDPKLAAVPLALRASLVAFAIGSTFLSRVQFDLTYFVLMAAAAWMPIEHQRLLEIAEQLEDEEDEADLPDSEADPAAA